MDHEKAKRRRRRLSESKPNKVLLLAIHNSLGKESARFLTDSLW